MRGRFSLPYRVLPVQTTRPLAVPYVGVTSNRGVMESRNGSKLERKLHDLRGCVCALPRTRKEGRKEGSKTWLTVDHRSHQDTSSLPPSLFLSLRFTDRGTPPPSIILLSRETPLSLSLSLILSWRGLVEKKRFPSRLERNYGAGTARSKEKQRGGKIQLRSKRASKDRTRRKFFHSFSFPFVRVGPATSSLLPQSRAHVCSLGFLIKRREKKRRPV